MDHQEIIKAAKQQGWRVVGTKGGWLLFPPDKTFSAVSLHETPSDHRWIKNFRREMERRGFLWPGKG